MSIYSEGICSDGAVILKDGAPMPISDVIAQLNNPIPAAPAVPDEYQIIAIFKRAGFNIELGVTYSAKGQIAQLIEGARKLLAAASEQQGGAG
jgi:hypothetical protein